MTKQSPYSVTVETEGEFDVFTYTLRVKKDSANTLAQLAAEQYEYQSKIQDTETITTEVEGGEDIVEQVLATNEDGTPKMIDNPVTMLDFLGGVVTNFLRDSAKARAKKIADEQAAQATEEQFNSMLS